LMFFTVPRSLQNKQGQENSLEGAGESHSDA